MQITLHPDVQQATAIPIETPRSPQTDKLGDTERWFMEPMHLALVVAAAHVALGLFVTIAGDATGSMPMRHHLFNAGLSLYGCAGGIWLLARLRPVFAVKMGALNFGVVAVVAASRLAMPGFLTLIPLPVFLFGSVGSFPTILVLMASQVCALIGLAGGSGWPDILLVLLANLGALLLAYGARCKHLEAARWARSQYDAMRYELEQARNRNMELSQVLDELVHANRQLDLMNERVAAMRAKAEDARRSKEAFVAKVSHEFRTPLNMIIGLTDLLVEHPQLYGEHLPCALLEDLQIVHRNCEHLASMVNDVLERVMHFG